MVHVDDHSGFNVEPAPDAEGLVETADRTLARPIDQRASPQFQSAVSLTTRPMTADSTTSAVEPKTTGMPRLAGA